MTTQPVPAGAEPVGPVRTEDRRTAVAREREAFGGVKIGSARQGAAGFGWAVVVAVVLGVVGAVAGARYNELGELNGFPHVPSSIEGLTLQGVVVLVGVVVVGLVGAILGGPLGMRYHRRVDKTGLGR